MGLERDAGPHLDEAAVAGYLDRTLAGAERRRVEAHLVACAECRDEVAEAARVLTSVPRTRHLLACGGLAAAAVLTLLLVRPGADRGAPGPVSRGSEEADARRPGVELVAPPADAAVPARAFEFVWRSAGTDASYRVVVTDLRGDTVWSASVTDTAVPAPPQGTLAPGGSYFWYVDALAPDGSEHSSDVRDLTMAP